MKTRIACVQMQSKLGDKEANYAKMKEKAEEIAARSRPDLIVYPELAVTGYECSELYPELAEEYPDGEYIQKVAALAKNIGAYIAFGFVEKEKTEDSEYIYNTIALADKRGRLVGRYRKSHLVEGAETENFTKGTEYNVFSTEIGKIGIMVCWDAAYPEVARCLALKGAEIIICPAAWEVPFDDDWDIVQCARSFDNVLYVASCNHVGTDRDLTFFGKSKIVGPVGRTITEAGDGEEIIEAEVDLDILEELRNGFYVLLKDRNPGTYGEIVKESNV